MMGKDVVFQCDSENLVFLSFFLGGAFSWAFREGMDRAA
jgi:hypothetical protein